MRGEKEERRRKKENEKGTRRRKGTYPSLDDLGNIGQGRFCLDLELLFKLGQVQLIKG